MSRLARIVARAHAEAADISARPFVRPNPTVDARERELAECMEAARQYAAGEGNFL